MRKFGLIILSLWLHVNVNAQSIDVEVGYALAQELLQWEELNPIHKADCEEILKAMNSAFEVNEPDAEKVNTLLQMVDGAIPVMIEDSYDDHRKNWQVVSVFVSLALYSEGEKRMFYLDLANHIARTDSDQTYAAVLLLEYIESIGSGAVEKRRSMLLAYVQAYEEEIGIEFAERIYAFLGEK
jgi:hypothetical protein